MNTPVHQTADGYTTFINTADAARYCYAAMIDEQGNELPITDGMIRSACESACETLHSFMPERLIAAKSQAGQQQSV